MSFVPNETEVVRILAGLHLRLDEVFVGRPFWFLTLVVVLVGQSNPRQLSMPRSIVWPLPPGNQNGFVGEARCGER